MRVCLLGVAIWWLVPVPFGWSAEQPDPQGVRLERLAQALGDNTSPDGLLPLLLEASPLLWDDDRSQDALPLVELAVARLMPATPSHAANGLLPELLRAVARLRFQLGEPERAARHLHTALDAYERRFAELPPEALPAQRAQWTSDIVLEFLRGDQIEAALELAGTSYDAQLAAGTLLLDAGGDVGAAWNRRLLQRSTNERYELLHRWMMPTDSRPHVRIFASWTPRQAPPVAFARAIGERPRADAFPIPRVGPVEGLFSTGWLLVTSAAESGQLRKLSGELEALVHNQVPGADHLWRLARIVDESTDAGALGAEIAARLSPGDPPLPSNPTAKNAPSTATTAPTIQRSPRDHLAWMVAGAACLGRAPLQPTGQTILASLQADPIEDAWRARGNLARAISFLPPTESAAREWAGQGKFALWVAAGDSQLGTLDPPPGGPGWLAYEDHLVHLAGPHRDYLCLRYPLEGDFQFHVDAQYCSSDAAAGNLAFGGLAYTALGRSDELRASGLDLADVVARYAPYVRRERWPTYQRLTVESTTSSGVRLLVNGHEMYHDSSAGTTSPWLALHCLGEQVTAYRQPRLTGQPVIPRSVSLSEGTRLRGWLARRDGQPASNPVVLASSAVEAPSFSSFLQDATALLNSNWRIQDGVIHASHWNSPLRHVVPAQLTYFRPLQSGESLEYEFLYQPGQCEVHPVLGRLVFLIEPTGVRVRWLTSGERDWTGLDGSHAIIEPFFRRGGRSLPLKSGEWNRVSLKLNGDALSIALNDVEVYARKMEPEIGRRFSLYYDANHVEARVRQVVLRGDWPDTFPREALENLLVRDESAPRLAEAAQVGERLLGQSHLADSAVFLHDQGKMRAPEERYRWLAEHVLPGTAHAELRMLLGFTPTHPAPIIEAVHVAPASPAPGGGEERRTARVRRERGGELVSPAIDLVAVAKQLGRLDEVRERVLAAPADTDWRQRQRLALLALVEIARDDVAAANDALFQLFKLVEQGTHTEFEQRMPETIAAWAALRHAGTRPAGSELTFYLHLRQARSGASSGHEAWRRHIASETGLAHLFDEQALSTADEFPVPPPLEQWSPVSRVTARSRGEGYPRAHWQVTQDGVEARAGHGLDFLYFQSPLAGNYAIECDMPPFGWRDTQVVVAGEWLFARYDLKSIAIGNVRQHLRYLPVEPPFQRPSDALHYRVAVQDGMVTTSVNGRVLHQRTQEANADSWLAIRSDEWSDGGARNVRILGEPTIPESLLLAESPDLNGWIAYYDTERVGGADATWQPLAGVDAGAGVIGARQPVRTGSSAESLLQYHRPMLEDGTIEYEFYYEEGVADCHPALDRLAFILDPQGVQLHWITDGRYDRTGLAPDNQIDEPESRRHPLQLVPHDWNRVALTLAGNTVQLNVNGQRILERDLEATNQRLFGLFHYADRTEVRARRISWRGDWPRVLPPVKQQELAGQTTEFLDERLPALKASLVHDFARDGLTPSRFAVLNGESLHQFQVQPDGLHVERKGTVGYRNASLSPQLSIHGDFDIRASYEQLVTEAVPDGSASLYLQVTMDDPLKSECMVMRRQSRSKTGADQQYHQTATVIHSPQGERRNYSRSMPSETSAGQLRLARRGRTVYFLMTEDSTNFRILRTEEMSDAPVTLGNLRLMVQTHGPGRASVVWKTLALYAERLEGAALEDQRDMVAELDRLRTGLPVQLDQDFTRQRVAAGQFTSWNLTLPSVPPPEGLLLVGPPSDTWLSAGVGRAVALSGDWDASVEFSVRKMTPPKQGQSSAVYLQVDIPDAVDRQYSILLAGMPEGTRSVTVQVRERDATGKADYLTLSRTLVTDVHRMRIARHGGHLYFLYADQPSQPDRLLTRCELAQPRQTATWVRTLAHTGGAGATLEAQVRKLTIRGR